MCAVDNLQNFIIKTWIVSTNQLESIEILSYFNILISIIILRTICIRRLHRTEGD